MSATVALILQIDSAITFEAIARCMPVWIVDTPGHAHLRERSKVFAKSIAVTWFPLEQGESLEQATVRIAFSLDDHYNEHAQTEGYRFLLVVGAKYDKSMNVDFAQLDFKQYDSTMFGFVAEK